MEFLNTKEIFKRSFDLLVRNGARFKNKLIGVMVNFNLQKINTNQYYESVSLNAGNNSTIREYMTLQDDSYI